MVSGIRSPVSSVRTMTNCPGCAERAHTRSMDFSSARYLLRGFCFSRISNIRFYVWLLIPFRATGAAATGIYLNSSIAYVRARDVRHSSTIAVTRMRRTGRAASFVTTSSCPAWGP